MRMRIHHLLVGLGVLMVAYALLDLVFLSAGTWVGNLAFGIGLVVIGLLLKRHGGPLDPEQVRRDNAAAIQGQRVRARE